MYLSELAVFVNIIKTIKKLHKMVSLYRKYAFIGKIFKIIYVY